MVTTLLIILALLVGGLFVALGARALLAIRKHRGDSF